MKVKPFKIKVESESHSREIQEWLFSKKCFWCNGSTDVISLNAKHLILSRDEEYEYGYHSISCTSSSKIFEESDLPEVWFYDGQIHYEPKPQTLPEFKIKVESEKHSREIQEWLFSLGYSWCTGSTDIDKLDAKYLFLYEDEGEDLTIGWDSSLTYFEASSLPEAWFYNGKLHDKPQTQSQTRTHRQVVKAIISGEELQYLDSSGKWLPITYFGFDARHLDSQYPRKVRVKPRICNGVELDSCLTEPPKSDSYYFYYPDPTHVDFFNMKPWANDADDIYWLELGFVYDSIESAAKHGKAMGKYEVEEE